MKRINWQNVRYILARELKDQLRDRRTLFIIFVLPLLLYPILGIAIIQVGLFGKNPPRVLIIGANQLPEAPALVEGGHFSSELLGRAPNDGDSIKTSLDATRRGETVTEEQDRARQLIEDDDYEAVLIFPPNFADEMTAYRQRLASVAEKTPAAVDQVAVPSAEIIHSSAKQRSLTTTSRVKAILSSWSTRVRQTTATSLGIDPAIFQRVDIAEIDVAEASHRNAAIWSNVFPIMLLIWALTGAFYPAVDLCAGEKERGTLETLLSSPAERTEIVWGKLLTVTIFSMATVVFNLLSIGITGAIVMRQLPPDVGPPPLSVIPIVLIALVPVSMLFSAICLALAAFARSSKEGQYYLMPVLLATIPLVMLPVDPNVELSLGTSLIPITGVMLLMRSMIEGDYLEALPYILPVMAVTLGGCLLALQWAVDQFNSESVLFREGERFQVRLWMRQLMRDREDTPSAFEAILLGLLILLLRFGMSFVVTETRGPNDTLVMAAVTQISIILAPVLLMTVMLTRSPRKTLLLRLPSLGTLVAAVCMAIALHPSIMALNELILWLYPLPESVSQALKATTAGMPITWLTLCVLAVLPAMCEELAFRGFILSGLRHLGHRWRAIILTSVLFGLAHPIFQQSIAAFIVGILLGYLAVKTRSILPGMAYHMVHNATLLVVPTYLLGLLKPYLLGESTNVALTRLLSPFFEVVVTPSVDQRMPPAYDLTYRWPLVLLSLIISGAILVWLRRRRHEATAEEAIQEAIDQESAFPAAG